MNRTIRTAAVASFGAAVTAAVLAAGAPAGAATITGIPVVGACSTGWYVNADEAAYLPVQQPGGLLFEGKDLVHHATTPLDLADVKTHTLSFSASAAGKVVGKMETTSPYSTIVQNADGTFWSTAMTYDQVGGQGSPVLAVADLVGKPTKPGKPNLTAETKVVTFGVGYWVEAGSTVVSSITFHGTVYGLTCQTTSPSPSASVSTSASASPSASVSTSASASPSASVSTSASASPSASVSTSTSASPSASVSTSASARPSASTTVRPSASTSTTAEPVPTATVPARPGGGSGLPLTGVKVTSIAALAAVTIGAGIVLLVLARRRKMDGELS